MGTVRLLCKIIINSSDPLRAKKTFVGKKVGPYHGFGY